MTTCSPLCDLKHSFNERQSFGKGGFWQPSRERKFVKQQANMVQLLIKRCMFEATRLHHLRSVKVLLHDKKFIILISNAAVPCVFLRFHWHNLWHPIVGWSRKKIREHRSARSMANNVLLFWGLSVHVAH